MYNNLIIEMIKRGYKEETIPYILANILSCSKKIIEYKLKNTEEFTFQDVIKINSVIFNNNMNIKYLFYNEQKDGITYGNEFLQKIKSSEWKI